MRNAQSIPRESLWLTTEIAERFWSAVERGRGCWIWLGTMTPAGYGCFHAAGKNRAAHRVAYELANGPFPNELLVMHRCDTPCCVRPSHLHIGSKLDNCIDRDRSKRGTRGLHPVRNTYHPATGILTRNYGAPL